MPTPVATLGSVSVSGDVITGLCVNYIRSGMACATLSCPVAGAACVGAVAVSSSVNKIRMGLPLANITAVIQGANPVLGFPVVTAIGITPALTVIR